MLINEAGVDVVPGPVFGSSASDVWIRVCFARSVEFIDEALTKISDIAAKMR